MIDNELEVFEHVDNSFSTHAACKGLPTEWWFPTTGMNVVQTPSLKMAKEICGTCKVRKECFEYGQATSSWGVWGGITLSNGGMSTRDRKRLANAA